MIEICLVFGIVIILGIMVWLLPLVIRDFRDVHNLRAETRLKALAKAHERRRLMLNFLRKQ